MQWLGSLVFTTFLFVWTGLYAIFFAIVASLTPYRQRFALTRGWGIVLLWVLKRTCHLDYRVEGRDNLPAGVTWRWSNTHRVGKPSRRSYCCRRKPGCETRTDLDSVHRLGRATAARDCNRPRFRARRCQQRARAGQAATGRRPVW
jgi:hypothetical protein